MEFTLQREVLLKPLQMLAGVVERRQTLPILGNILICAQNGRISFTGTDMEIELLVHVPCDKIAQEGSTTVPARKFVDVCRALLEDALVSFQESNGKALVQSGKSRFVLASLPAKDYPVTDEDKVVTEVSLSQEALKGLIERTGFAMAQQDVRYYLNGMLLEFQGTRLRAVATDGHRLATQEISIATNLETSMSVILPRKAVIELMRLLVDDKSTIRFIVGQNILRIKEEGHKGHESVKSREGFEFSSKLIDGKFPNYQRVLPQGEGHEAILDRDLFKQALSRVSVIFSDKFKGATLFFTPNLLTIRARNSDQDEVEELLEMDYTGPNLEIGFNISYILDYINILKNNRIVLKLLDANSSALLAPFDVKDDQGCCVVMPMKI